MRLSVIVPVYNAEQYLHRCLDSLLNQGLNEDEIEILCVDDGSIDESLDILTNYAKKHQCISVYSQKNSGSGAARNVGLEHARGDVITFCDADDYLVPQALAYVMHTFWDYGVDVICHGSTTLDARKLKSWKENNDVHGVVICQGDGRSVYENDPKFFVWNSIIRSSFLKKLNLRFKASAMGEDAAFMLEVMMNASRAIDVSCNIYRYTVHANQVTQNRDAISMRISIENYLDLLARMKYYDQVEAFRKQLIPYYSRVLSANLSSIEWRDLQCRHKTINLYSFPYSFYCIGSYLYRKLFLPFVLPHMKRG